MSAELYTNLTWLPQAPEDFATQCRGIFEAEGGRSSSLQALARYAPDDSQLIRLAKLIAEAR
jgi:hypothetical protein